MIRLSTFRRAARSNRRAYDAMKQPGDLTEDQRAAMNRDIVAANDDAYALFDECGIDRSGPDSPARYKLQGRILAAVNRASDVDWSVS